MQRQIISVLAISCVLMSAGYAQTASPPAPLPRTHGPEKQESAADASGKEASGANPSAVGMDEAVITLKGGCEPKGDIAPSKDCISAVTRAQFEKLANALQPDMPAAAKRGLATNYARWLVYSDVARALHLENDPNVQEIVRFITDQILTEGLRRHYAEQFAHPSDQEIQDYYNQNSAKYMEATLQRIIIPNNPGTGETPEATQAKAAAAAEKIRQRWVAGEDPVKLQQAAFAGAGVTGASTPDVNLGAKRAGSPPVNHESVFQLKAGEVSQVYSDPAATYIYKVVSVREIPLSEVKDSIIKTLQQQQLQKRLEEIGKSVTPVLNDEYFGPPPAAGSPAAGGRPNPGGAPRPGGPPN